MITAEQIISLFPNGNYDPALLTTRLGGVYIMYIKPFLGTDFYNELVSQYNSDTLTINNQLFLSDYLQPIIAHYSMYDSLKLANATPTASGLMGSLPEFGRVPSDNDKSLSYNNILASGEAYVKAATDYLNDNPSLYPLWKRKEIKGKTGLIFYGSNSQVSQDINR